MIPAGRPGESAASAARSSRSSDGATVEGELRAAVLVVILLMTRTMTSLTWRHPGTVEACSGVVVAPVVTGLLESASCWVLSPSCPTASASHGLASSLWRSTTPRFRPWPPSRWEPMQ